MYDEYEEFIPDFPGDTPNRQWVRHASARKGIEIDMREVLKRLPQVVIDKMFWDYVIMEAYLDR